MIGSINKKGIWILALSMLSITACKNSEEGKESKDEATVMVDLYMRYLQDEKQAKISATFLEKDGSGLRKPYTEKVKMWIQGRSMDALPEVTKAGSYQMTLDGVTPDVFEYVLEVAPKKTESIALDLKARNSPEIVSFSLTEGLKLLFSKMPLGERENLVIIVTDSEDKSASMTVNGPFSGTAILSPQNYQQLKPGPCQLYMVWKGRSSERAAQFQIEKDLEFYFKKVQADLEM